MNTDSVLVYVAGPMSHGDQVLNVRAGVLAGLQIQQAGHLAFVPHLNYYMHFLMPMPYEFWLSMDLRMLKRCDCLVRLPGHSPGADREVELAKTLGMPIYHSVEECLRDLPVLRQEALP